MKTNFSLVRKAAFVTMCAAVLSPAALFAGNVLKTAEEHGLIKSVDVKTHQLVVTDQKTKAEGTFQWNDQTKFIEHGKPVSATALKAGLPVNITYAAGSGTPMLERVQIPADKEPKPAATPATRPKS